MTPGYWRGPGMRIGGIFGGACYHEGYVSSVTDVSLGITGVVLFGANVTKEVISVRSVFFFAPQCVGVTLEAAVPTILDCTIDSVRHPIRGKHPFVRLV